MGAMKDIDDRQKQILNYEHKMSPLEYKWLLEYDKDFPDEKVSTLARYARSRAASQIIIEHHMTDRVNKSDLAERQERCAAEYIKSMGEMADNKHMEISLIFCSSVNPEGLMNLSIEDLLKTVI